MTIRAGTQLGSYEIISPLGAGGMGEVYRARDSKLNRDVALKVLPEALAHDAERLARFQREAQVLAPLNHPNIASIHGLEEPSNTRALVMELVEGPTLAERIKRGALPVDEVLPVARQIAEALEYAHERGIIHCDLKPANGMEAEKPLITGPGESMPSDWSRDSRYLTYYTQSRTTQKFDIWIKPMTGGQKPFSFIATPANEVDGQFSPDGSWFAYMSDESGRFEVYVVPFPSRSGKWQVSSSGGGDPFWVANGTELDYFTPDNKWIAVEVNGRGSDFSIGGPKPSSAGSRFRVLLTMVGSLPAGSGCSCL